MSNTDNNAKPIKKLSVADLQQVIGGRSSSEPKIKIEVENSGGTQKADGEG